MVEALIVFEPLIGPNIPETVEIVLAFIVFEPLIGPYTPDVNILETNISPLLSRATS